MRQGLILGSFILWLLLLLSPREGGAQSEGDKVKAKKLFKEGVSYFESGKHAQALEAFQESYRLRPHWAIRFNLGLCYKELGMYTKAKEEFLRFLEEGGKEVKETTREEVEKELMQLSGIIAVLEIKVNVAGAKISLDGRPLGESPLPGKIEIDPGPHRITVERDGYEPYEDDFILSKGERRSFAVALLPKQKTTEERLEEKEISEMREEAEEKEKGKEEVKVEGEGKEMKIEEKGEGMEGEKERGPQVVATDKEKKTRVRKKWGLPVFVTTAALAVAAAGGGSATLALAYKKKGEMEEIDERFLKNPSSFGEDNPATPEDEQYRSYTSQRRDITDKGMLFAYLTYSLYGLAGASAVVALLAATLGHPFAKVKVEAEEPAAPSPDARRMGTQVGIVFLPAGGENHLILHLSF